MTRTAQEWLHPRLLRAAELQQGSAAPIETGQPLWLGIDLGTCDVVSMVVDADAVPVAVCLDWADVVRDGVVWDFFGAVNIVRQHLNTLEAQFGRRFECAATSFPPGTDPRISINVLEAAGLTVRQWWISVAEPPVLPWWRRARWFTPVMRLPAAITFLSR